MKFDVNVSNNQQPKYQIYVGEFKVQEIEKLIRDIVKNVSFRLGKKPNL